MTIRSRKRAAEGADFERLVAQETLIVDVTEEISRLLNEQGLTRAELAERLGRTRGFVTQLLSGERNMTLRTASDLAFALGHRILPQAVPAETAAAEGASENTWTSLTSAFQSGMSGIEHFSDATPQLSLAAEASGEDVEPRDGAPKPNHEFSLAA